MADLVPAAGVCGGWGASLGWDTGRLDSDLECCSGDTALGSPAPACSCYKSHWSYYSFICVSPLQSCDGSSSSPSWPCWCCWSWSCCWRTHYHCHCPHCLRQDPPPRWCSRSGSKSSSDQRSSAQCHTVWPATPSTLQFMRLTNKDWNSINI